MYRLLSGLHAHLTRKEEFNVIILGLDQAGKTTLLEKVKTIFSPSQPGLNPSQISTTIGQNIGRITLSSTYLKFWDLGGSKEIRAIWEKYYDEADAICWVLDSHDRYRNGWMTTRSQMSNSNGGSDGVDAKGKGKAKATNEPATDAERGEGWIELERVLQHPSVAQSNIPVLVIANKQDREPRPQGHKNSSHHSFEKSISSTSEIDLEAQQEDDPMTVEEIKQMFNRLANESNRSEKARSLGLSDAHVLGVSALNGHGIREAINWLFYRVATKGQSRKTQQLKNQQQNDQQSNPYLHQASNRRQPTLDPYHRDSSLKNNYIKLADLNKLNGSHHSNSST